MKWKPMIEKIKNILCKINKKILCLKRIVKQILSKPICKLNYTLTWISNNSCVFVKISLQFLEAFFIYCLLQTCVTYFTDISNERHSTVKLNTYRIAM